MRDETSLEPICYLKSWKKGFLVEGHVSYDTMWEGGLIFSWQMISCGWRK